MQSDCSGVSEAEYGDVCMAMDELGTIHQRKSCLVLVWQMTRQTCLFSQLLNLLGAFVSVPDLGTNEASQRSKDDVTTGFPTLTCTDKQSSHNDRSYYLFIVKAFHKQ